MAEIHFVPFRFLHPSGPHEFNPGYPRYPRYPQAPGRFSAWSDSENRCNDLPVAGSGLPETDRRSQARPSGGRLKFARTEAGRSKVRATGRKKREAAAQAKAEPTFLRGSGGTRSPRAEGTAKGHEEASLRRRPIGNRSSKPQGREGRNPPGNRRPAARQGSEPAGTGTGPAMVLRRNLRDRPGPQGLGRNLPGKGGHAFGQDQRNQGQWRPAAMPASISFWGPVASA
jgi:hypothetical protein